MSPRRSDERRARDEAVEAERRQGDRRQDIDRRMDPRIPVQLWIHQENGDEVLLRQTADISAGGVHLAQGLPPQVGTRVRIRFSIPGDDQEFSAIAEVAAAGWSEEEGPRTNLRFVDVPDKDHERLNRLITMHSEAGSS